MLGHTLAVITNFEMQFNVPVTFDAELESAAEARGVLFRRILIGERFLDAPPPEQMAILLHEFGHHANWHRLIRWLTLPLFWTRWVQRMNLEQECEADWFAVAEGYGAFLAMFLSRFDGPDARERVSRIRQLLQEQIHVAHAA